MLNAYAQTAAPAQASPLVSLLPVIIIFVIFYFLLIRPQKKQQADHKKMVQSLKKNDEVVTSGGVNGTIVNIKDKTVVVRVDDNVKLEIQRSSISTVKKRREE